MPLYPVVNDYPDEYKIPPANRIDNPGALTLYSSSTGFEKALADTDAERLMDIYAEAIIDQWNPWQVAYEHLPFLAWAQGVNLWESWWDETFKRGWVARQWYLKSIRGKRAGLDEFVIAVGGQVKRCIVPPARAYGTKAMTDVERAAYVARFPQLRIYPYVAREQLPWLCYCGKHYNGTGQLRVWNKNGAFLGPRWKMYPTIQNAGGKYTRTATLYEPRTGVETKLTVRRIARIHTGQDVGWGFTPGVSQYDESVILPLEHRPAYFIREHGKYLGHNIYLGEALPLRTISIGRSGYLDLVQGKAQYQTVFPQEELLNIRPEYVAIKHPRRKTELYAARGEYLIRANFLHIHFASGGLVAGSPVFSRVELREFAGQDLAGGRPVFGAPTMTRRIANYDPDTTAWIEVTEAWSGRTISTARKVLVDNMIVGLKADGVWPQFDRLWVFAAEDIYGAVVDLKRRRIARVHGAPFFLVNRGFTCVGATGYVGLDYRFIVDGEQYTQNSAHIACWNLTDGTNVLPTLVGDGAGGHEDLFAKYTDNKAYARINDNPDTPGLAIGDCRGMLLGNRSDGVTRNLYFNGTSLGAYGSNNSQKPSDLELIALTRELAMVSVGGSLSAAQQSAFYNRVNTYLSAMLAALPPPITLAMPMTAGHPVFGAPALAAVAGGTDADAVAWVAAVGGGNVSGTRQGHVNTLIVGLKADGVWAKLDRLWLLAAENTASALVDLKARATATPISSPSFTPNRGYAATATSTVDFNYTPSTHAVVYGVSAAHVSAWNIEAGAYIGYPMLTNSVTDVSIYPKYSDNLSYGRVNDRFSAGLPAPSDLRGFYLANRSSFSGREFYFNGASLGTMATMSSEGLPASTIVLYAWTGAAVSFGASLNATEQLAFYNRLRTYMTAVGVP